MNNCTYHTADIVILGAGGAGLFAALHALRRDCRLDICVVSKGLLGKSGCTRMVQGGYNVALSKGDSLERHFMDTIIGGKWLPHQALAWRLVSGAVERVQELENELGCFFDRNADGSLHHKAFAGQSFDRTVHKGDLTGIEIINRLMEQVIALPVTKLEEHRAMALVPANNGESLSGVLLLDVRTGACHFVRAKAVLLATGGGPTMYRYHTPSGDKSCDGMAMALRLGLRLRDMEMVQFHPTGLLSAPDSRMTGTVLEEGLRGSGGWLLNGRGERFMHNYDAAGERATRDVVSRAVYSEIREGRGAPNGGVFIQVAHLGAEEVRRQFAGMVKRCADCGFDLAGDKVEVVPTAHYMMGGIEFALDCQTSLPGLFAAGEDCGGVHGANRLGGNGVAESTVFGGIAGERMADWVKDNAEHCEPDTEAIAATIGESEDALARPIEGLYDLREELAEVMWEDAGIIRNAAGLRRSLARLSDLDGQLARCGGGGGNRRFNLTWHDWLNTKNLVEVSGAIVHSALARSNSCGAHFRDDDHGEEDDIPSHVTVRHQGGAWSVERVPVDFSIVRPGESLLDA